MATYGLLPARILWFAGIEKIGAAAGRRLHPARLLTRSATGQEITSYVSFMSGPKRAGDATGPQGFHVVLLDMAKCARQSGARSAALHPLRRVHESLPGLWRDRRHAYGATILASGGGARPRAWTAGPRPIISRTQRAFVAVRIGLVRENPAHPHHATLAE